MNTLPTIATGLLAAVASLVVSAGAGHAQTHSKWTSITPDPRQFAAQPGGVLPLAVLGGSTPYFDAGQYMVYVAPSNPDGRTVSRWSAFGPFTLRGQDKWKATLRPQAQLSMERNPAPLLPYASPGPAQAMIYVRNEDVTSWHSICVLPVGAGKTVQPDCFGGTSNVVFDPSGAETPPAAAGAAGFSVTAAFDNWDVNRTKEDSIALKRTTAKTKAPCGWDAVVNASITAKFLGAAPKPKDAAEALALAEASFKARRQGATPADMAVGLVLVGGREGASSFAMGEFRGAIADFALWLRRGSWGAGYTGESFGSNGAGHVVRNGEVIEFSYGVSGGGCWDNSSRSYLVTQGIAAQEEARAILASLRWDGRKSTVKVPYTGPRYDGSDLARVTLKPAALPKLSVGDTVTIEATVQNAKPEDQPLTFNWSGAFDGTPAAARSSPVVRLRPTKPGKYRVDVAVDGARFALGRAGVEYEVVATPATSAASATSGATSGHANVTLQSHNYRDRYARHRSFLGEITPLVSQQDRADAAFAIVPGLAGGDSVSIESRNHPGHYFRHQGGRVKLHRPDGTELFRRDASFRMVPGLANPSWTSFESVNYPGHFLRHLDFHLYVQRGDGELFRRDATFKVSGAPTTSAASAPERDVIRISNSGGVHNAPTAPTVVTFDEAHLITFLSTYHWNAGRGTPRPGTIALRHSSGRVYGPWNATGAPGQGGVPNANWEARPNVEVPPGAYTVIDSDPTTWSHNAESGGRGFVVVRGHRRQ